MVWGHISVFPLGVLVSYIRRFHFHVLRAESRQIIMICNSVNSNVLEYECAVVSSGQRKIAVLRAWFGGISFYFFP